MSLATDIDTFADLMKSQGPAFLSGENDILNLASKRTYTLTRFLQGKTKEEMLQGGSKIKDTIMFNARSDYQHYKPNQEFDYSNPQVLNEWEVDWRFTTDNMQWTDHELGLNSGQMTKTAKIHRFKSLKRKLEMNMMTNFLNQMDNDLWLQPNAATMEGAAGTAPYSIPVFINEWSNASSAANGAGGTSGSGLPGHPAGGTVWTKIQNIAPGSGGISGGKWQNELVSYSDVAASSSENLFRALSKMFYLLHYDRMPKQPSLGEASTWPNFIATSLAGVLNFERLLRVSQDAFLAGRQDPSFPNPTFRGVPVVYIEDLNTASIFRTGSTDTSFGNEASNANVGNGFASGPRYFVITGQYFCPVWHSERYFWKKNVDLPRQPFNHVQVVDCWHQFLARARNRNGLVYPSAAITI